MVYTAYPHTYTSVGDEEERDAIGLISGGATVDGGPWDTAAREREFPFALISKSLNIKVEDAKATEEADRLHILNSIAGRGVSELNKKPLKGHANYTAIDDAVRATFVSTVQSLQSAHNSGDETIWTSTLSAMSKGTNPLKMLFYLEGWKGMTAEKAVALIDNLPPTTVSLTLDDAKCTDAAKLRFTDAKFEVDFVYSVAKHIRTTSNLRYLNLAAGTVVGGEDGRKAGVRLAEAVSSNTTITEIYLSRMDLIGEKNVKEWATALMANKTLRELYLNGVEKKVVEKLKKATKSRTPELFIVRYT